MKQNYLLLVLSSVLLSSTFVFGQQESTLSLYKYNLNQINPAATATQGATYLNVNYRTQWVGVDGAPETQTLSLGVPSETKKLGVGFSVSNDKINVQGTTQLFVDFSYPLQIDSKRTLYLGLKAGGTSSRIDAAQLNNSGGPVDPFLVDDTRFSPNFGVGVYYLTENNFFVSLSIPRLLSTERFSSENGQASLATDKPHLYLSSGIQIPLSEQWSIKPSILLAQVANTPVQFVGDFTMSLDDKLDFGVQYNRGGGFGGTTTFALGSNFRVGYAYINSLSNTPNAFSSGTHEILLKIKLGPDINKDRQVETTLDGAKRSEKIIGTKSLDKQ
ncbi:PorP/SprF family type IX secretion system membrane protein [Flavobacteriaceae bacterium]|nr:PorP/SprF family type IX secretion system membrane protein [Flavobacteriaceae bacterium]